MTDEAKEIVEALRKSACNGCIHDKIGRCMHIQQGKFCGSERHKAADLIEKLIAQLVNQATEYSRALKITTEQRDALKADMLIAEVDGFCQICAHLGCNDKAVCPQARDEYDCFEWRGVKEE